MRARKDEDCLICICQQHLLIITLRPWVQPDDGALPFFDLFDYSAAIRQNCDAYIIPNGRDVACGSPHFQFAAQLTNDKALPSFHCEETRLGFDDQTL